MNFVDFYLGKAPDDRGRMLEDILRWRDDRLETSHDFIQVLFPLAEASNHIPSSPVLDDDTLTEFRNNETIRRNLLRSFRLMLAFYGFVLDEEKGEVTQAPDFRAKADNWLFVGDHNHLRITRILRCLSACGLVSEAAAFQKALLAIAQPGKVSEETIGYWQRAVPTDA